MFDIWFGQLLPRTFGAMFEIWLALTLQLGVMFDILFG
jgi:hypothetical protein